MVEAVQHQPARELKDRIIARRSKEARNIAKIATPRKLLTCVFYAMRDGMVRSLTTPQPRARGWVSRLGHGQRVIARRSGPAPGRRGSAAD